MPTYSYRCTACGNEFDVRQSFSDDPLTVCGDCGGKLRKLFNSVGIVFKGSGFYHNDSKSKSNLTSTSSEGSSSSSSDGSSTDSSSAPTSSSAPAKDSSTTTKPALSSPGRSA